MAKYAQASTVTVDLFDGDGTLRFEVRDDGVGFDPRANGHGSGLQGIVRPPRRARRDAGRHVLAGRRHDVVRGSLPIEAASRAPVGVLP